MGALAAPQFTAVFDHSKDQADIAQMDLLMAAFQLEQAPYYETHDGTYDLLRTNNLRVLKNGKGEVVGTEVIPEKAVETLQTFLDDVTDSNRSVYMEDAVCVTTGLRKGKTGSVFRARLETDQKLKIVCEADGNESSIRLLIPKTDTISYVYSEDEPEEGTWMVIGDDDRLRAEYVHSMMHMSTEEAKKTLLKKDKGKEFYQYRTEFLIQHQEQDKSQIGWGDFWKLFTHKNVDGPQNIGLNPDYLKNGDIEYRYRWLQNKKKRKWVGDPYDYEQLNTMETINVAMGHTKEAAVVEFRNNDNGKIDYAKYSVQIFQRKDIWGTPDAGNNDANSGWIHTGANHWLYYELLAGSGDVGSGGSGGSENADEFTYHTGMTFNYVNENNYDFLSFEKNRSGEMVLRSYRIQGGSASGYKTEKVLSGFQFNQPYTMDLRIEKGKAIVNLSGGILEEDAVFSIGNDLHPAIGYYMGEEADLGRRPALSDYDQTLPLVTYEEGKAEGPRLVLRALPDFHTSEMEHPVTPPKEAPEPPVIERVGPETLTINPVEFRISTKEKENFTIKLKLPDGSSRELFARSQTFMADCSGKMEAYVEVKGKKSEKINVDVSNIIPPFAEIEGSYKKGSQWTDFVLTNYEDVWAAMKPYQRQETLYVILESKGEKYEVPGPNFYMWNSDLDLNDLVIYVESEYGEVLSPKAKIAQPKVPEIEFYPSGYWGYAQVTLSTQSSDGIYYRFLDEDQDPIGNWKTYTGSFEESFAYIETYSENDAGAQSEAIIKQNPYYNAVIPPPTITPLARGEVMIESIPGTYIVYKDGNWWYNAYSNRYSLTLEEGETIEVYAKNQFGSQESEIVSYTRKKEETEAPQPPVITKPYFNDNEIIISATDYDVIWYRYGTQVGCGTKWSDWKYSSREVSIYKNKVVEVEAYTVKENEVSETAVWSLWR